MAPPQKSGYTDSVRRLMELFGRLPGVGSRSAERMAFHILKSTPDEALALAEAIRSVKEHVRHCSVCYNLTERDPCDICGDAGRDHAVVCVVEQPKDLLQLEATGVYRGVYHVLLGRLAPLENIGPDQLTIPHLLERIRASHAAKAETPADAGGNVGAAPAAATSDVLADPDAPEASLEDPFAYTSPVTDAPAAAPVSPAGPHAVAIREVILATNPTLEGDGTALCLQQELTKLGVQITRLARGLPAGAQIEYANKAILADAISGRTKV